MVARKLCAQHATTRLQVSDAFHSPDAFTANLPAVRVIKLHIYLLLDT